MKRKNVVLICTDEWPGQLFGHRGRKDVMTPTIDFLADNGVMMENAYSECPVCIPARRSLMTGLTPEHHGDRVYSDRMEMPDCQTLAGAFSSAGYQTVAVGKMHVYPQRDRTGFDDVILMEEGRCEFGVMDDYEIWLGEQGKAGEQFMHGMGNNTYYTRPWHMDEPSHETSWITRESMKQIARRDPKRPFFLYVSYTYPHPPIVPLPVFLDKYKDVQCEPVLDDDWPEEWVIKQFRDIASQYSSKEREDARKAFMAQCTHIDYSIRLIIGSLREHNLLDDTILVFMSDHGDMLFDHKMVAKRLFYEGSASVPLIFSGRPMLEYRNKGYDFTITSSTAYDHKWIHGRNIFDSIADVVDELFVKIKHDLTERITHQEDHTGRAVDLIIIAKYLERIADHAVNIANWAIFCVTGQLQ